MFLVKVMECTRHGIQSLVRIYHNDFRRLKALSRLQLPAEILRMDSHRHPHSVKLRHFRLRPEIAGIDKIHGIDLTMLLRGIAINKCKERMVLMA